MWIVGVGRSDVAVSSDVEETQVSCGSRAEASVGMGVPDSSGTLTVRMDWVVRSRCKSLLSKDA